MNGDKAIFSLLMDIYFHCISCRLVQSISQDVYFSSSIFSLSFFCSFLSGLVLVLLSPHIQTFSVYRMQDFCNIYLCCTLKSLFHAFLGNFLRDWRITFNWNAVPKNFIYLVIMVNYQNYIWMYHYPPIARRRSLIAFKFCHMWD